jgi:hypothetical protein
VYANFTMVGTGPIAAVTSTSGGVGLLLRRGTGGFYVNGIVARWPRAAISLRDAETQQRFTEGNASLRSILTAESAALFEPGTGRFTIDALANGIVAAEASVTAASLFTALPAEPAGAASLDWSLSAASLARTGGTGTFTGALATRAGSFVSGTSYLGAADPSGAKWWTGWTSYARN